MTGANVKKTFLLWESEGQKIVEVEGTKAGTEWKALCPKHEDHQPSLCLNPQKGVYFCQGCGWKGQFYEPDGARTGADPQSQRRIVATYDYQDESGTLLYQVVRYDPKGFRQRRPDDKGGWTWSVQGVRSVLYRLPELIKGQGPVLLVEGEKDADSLRSWGLTATTAPGGAGKWRPQYVPYLTARDTVLIPDNDHQGRDHMRKVAEDLRGNAKTIKWLELPGVKAKGDVCDWIQNGGTKADFLKLVAQAPDFEAGAPSGSSASTDGRLRRAKTARESQADMLVHLSECAELFHTPKGDCFARIRVNDHFEIHRCKARRFQRHLSGRFWDVQGKVPSTTALASAVNVIEAKALYEGREHSLSNRVAWHEGAIWYDLTDHSWGAVRITSQGWEIVKHPPILFRKYAHQAPQVEPASGGEVWRLFDFVNIHGKDEQLLFLTYPLTALVPDIPHPVLILHGPQGSAKSWVFRLLKALLDPSVVQCLSFPKDRAELVQMLAHHWLAPFDNVSHLSEAESNALCRAVTGDGFAKRELYTDDEDVLYSFERCIGLNGINVAATRADLLDRAIVFGLRPIPANERVEDRELEAAFGRARPFILGALFDIFVGAMARYPHVKLPGLFRMADYTRWGAAVAETLGYSAEDFLDAYSANIAAQRDEVVQASLVGSALVAFMEDRSEWSGTPSALLQELENVAQTEKISTSARGWPKAPNVLTRRLNELSTTLREIGIVLERDRTPGGQRTRKLTIRRAVEDIVPTVPMKEQPSAPLGPSNDDSRDGTWDDTSDIAAIPSHPKPFVDKGWGDGDNGDDISSSLPERRESDLPDKIKDWPEDHREAYEERAAIMEVEGGLTRKEAEYQAEQQQRKNYVVRSGRQTQTQALCSRPPESLKAG